METDEVDVVTNQRQPMPRFVAFYTKGSGYEAEARGLVESLRRFSLPHSITAFESRGSWARNTQIKPEFLCAELQAGGPLVYLDVDARVLRRPTLFQTLDPAACDIAVHYRPDTRFRKSRELLSGTIYLSGSDACRQIVDCWAEASEARPGEMDQRTLQQLIDDQVVPGLRVRELPATYTKIFDIMRDVGPAVIEHYQASRRFRSTIR